jgi:proteic killer suppression protein
MIESFAGKVTEAIYHGKTTKGFPSDVLTVACRKLDMLRRASTLQDLRTPPGNRLEALKGDLAGFHSIRINDQWRIVFQWDQGSAYQVRIVDYH